MSGRPAPRPKRGGEEFARSRPQDDDTATKKPRFDIRNPSALAPDAPEEDAILEADEIGKRGQQTKRNAVNIDGYGSDSSNEGFDGRAELKAKAEKKNSKSKDKDADDMFADLEEEDDGDEEEDLGAKKKKKDVKFVDVDEIQGQVAGSKSGGHIHADFSRNVLTVAKGKGKGKQPADEDSSSSDSEVGDEVRAELNSDVDEEVGAGGKKKHAPKIDAFNLHAEKEDGGFDDQLNYVRKAADPDAVHDTWLQGVSKKDMKKAREAQDKRDQERRQKILEDDSILTSDLLKTLIPLLEPAETVLEALVRLGRIKEKKKPKWQNRNNKKRNQDMEIDDDAPAENPAETQRREAVEAITGAADLLLTRGQNDIYDAERELLTRQYKRETGEGWEDGRTQGNEGEAKRWEYRWSDARDGGEAHGPYDGETMVLWNDAGYFGEGVEFRQVEGGRWSKSVDFL